MRGWDPGSVRLPKTAGEAKDIRRMRGQEPGREEAGRQRCTIMTSEERSDTRGREGPFEEIMTQNILEQH